MEKQSSDKAVCSLSRLGGKREKNHFTCLAVKLEDDLKAIKEKLSDGAFLFVTNLVTSSLFFLILSTPGFSLSVSPFFPVAFLLFLFTAWLMVFAQCFGSNYNRGREESFRLYYVDETNG